MNARDIGVDAMSSVCGSAIAFSVVVGGMILAFTLVYLAGTASRRRQARALESLEMLERMRYTGYNEGFDAAKAGEIRKPPRDWTFAGTVIPIRPHEPRR